MSVDSVKIEQVGRVRVERLGHHLDVAIAPPGLRGLSWRGFLLSVGMVIGPIKMFVSAPQDPGGLTIAVLVAVVLAGLMIGRASILDAIMRISFVADGATFTLRRESRLEKTVWSGDVARLQIEGPQYAIGTSDNSRPPPVPRLMLTCDGAELEIGFGLSNEELEVVSRHWRLARSGTTPR